MVLEPPTLEELAHPANYLSVRQNQGHEWFSDSNLWGKLIILDKYLSVGQNKGLVWVLGPQSLKMLITSSIYLSDEQNLKGVRLLGSLTLSPFGKDVNPLDHKSMRKFALGA